MRSRRSPSTQPWRNYVDYAKDLPEADGSDQLRDQLVQITKYKDRTAKQKAYLGNKAIVRYMMSTIEDRGGADALVKFLTENTGRTEMSHTMDSTKGDLVYEPQGAYASTFKYLKDTGTTNRYLKYASPWANKGDGFLPDYVEPKDRKMLERAQDVTSEQRQGVLHDSSSWAHDRGWAKAAVGLPGGASEVGRVEREHPRRAVAIAGEVAVAGHGAC